MGGPVGAGASLQADGGHPGERFALGCLPGTTC